MRRMNGINLVKPVKSLEGVKSMKSRNSVKNAKGVKGVTLIELMVVVAIIGIIGAVAYPQYRNYITDTYRAQAVADLKLCAQTLERFYSNGYTYVGGDAQCTLWSPSDGAEASRQFTLSMQAISKNDYTIRATPIAGGCPCIELEADGTQTEIP